MEDPIQEIPGVIHSLTQTPPSIQHATIEKYFANNASFSHPFCRTGSFELSESINSRALIQAIYRWYKIMSPKIDLTVDSVAYDAASLILYVHITQTFRLWIVPFYAAPVSLVTVLQLVQTPKSQDGPTKYLIQSQNDLYQVNEFVRFFWFGGWAVVWVFQAIATFFCVVGAVVLSPQTWVEEKWGRRGWREIVS